jgi:hypothetical protein
MFFRIRLYCSCHLDLIPGHLPIFIMSESCTARGHPLLNPYIGHGIRSIEHLGDLDLMADNMMEEFEYRESVVDH